MNEPLVSIIIPVYNGANFLAEAIDSALAQTYSNTEVLVINDGSTDEGQTKRIAESYGKRIRYFEKENGGVATALNLGIREMKGDYFSWLSHDDLYLREKVSRQIAFFNANPAYKVCYSDYLRIDGNGVTFDTVATPWYSRRIAVGKLVGEGFINGCTLLIHKECFEKVGFFNEALKYTQDVEMWIRILLEYDMAHIPEVLIKQREHPSQGSNLISTDLYREARQMYLDVFTSYNILDVVYPRSVINLEESRRQALCYLWIGDRIAKSRADYAFSNLLYLKSQECWKSWKNPANFRLTLGARNFFLWYRIQNRLQLEWSNLFR